MCGTAWVCGQRKTTTSPGQNDAVLYSSGRSPRLDWYSLHFHASSTRDNAELNMRRPPDDAALCALSKGTYLVSDCITHSRLGTSDILLE